MALTRLAHQLIAKHFSDKEKRVAVDATCGNGHDTEFLIRLGFEQVTGFDIQQSALDNTAKRLKENNFSATQLILDGHQNLAQHITTADCIMFNFGYLPHGDKNITTQTNTSLTAIQSAINFLNKYGLISLLCYPGHDEGAKETAAIQQWLDKQDKLTVETHQSSSPTAKSPILFLVTSTI